MRAFPCQAALAAALACFTREAVSLAINRSINASFEPHTAASTVSDHLAECTTASCYLDVRSLLLLILLLLLLPHCFVLFPVLLLCVAVCDFKLH